MEVFFFSILFIFVLSIQNIGFFFENGKFSPCRTKKKGDAAGFIFDVMSLLRRQSTKKMRMTFEVRFKDFVGQLCQTRIF